MHDAHFWTLCTGTYYGTLTLDVMAGTDTRRTLAAARNILIQVGGAFFNTIILESLSFISVFAGRIDTCDHRTQPNGLISYHHSFIIYDFLVDSGNLAVMEAGFTLQSNVQSQLAAIL